MQQPVSPCDKVKHTSFREPESAVHSVAGRSRRITSEMLDALKELLLGKPDRQLDELAEFLLDEFDVQVPTPTISRTLKAEDDTAQSGRAERRFEG